LTDPSAVYLIERHLEGTASVEIFAARNAKSAREFLALRRVNKPNYRVIVRTNDEGTWIAVPGSIWLESLLPFQKDLRAAQVSGCIQCVLETRNPAGTCVMAEILCANCGASWTDGLRPGSSTVVRCPDCRSLNRVDPPRD
jgi:DNA-directed RNA polymerase subunit RPC12/RpoP